MSAYGRKIYCFMAVCLSYYIWVRVACTENWFCKVMPCDHCTSPCATKNLKWPEKTRTSRDRSPNNENWISSRRELLSCNHGGPTFKSAAQWCCSSRLDEDQQWNAVYTELCSAYRQECQKWAISHGYRGQAAPNFLRRSQKLPRQIIAEKTEGTD